MPGVPTFADPTRNALAALRASLASIPWLALVLRLELVPLLEPPPRFQAQMVAVTPVSPSPGLVSPLWASVSPPRTFVSPAVTPAEAPRSGLAGDEDHAAGPGLSAADSGSSAADLPPFPTAPSARPGLPARTPSTLQWRHAPPSAASPGQATFLGQVTFLGLLGIFVFPAKWVLPAKAEPSFPRSRRREPSPAGDRFPKLKTRSQAGSRSRHGGERLASRLPRVGKGDSFPLGWVSASAWGNS